MELPHFSTVLSAIDWNEKGEIFKAKIKDFKIKKTLCQVLIFESQTIQIIALFIDVKMMTIRFFDNPTIAFKDKSP